MIFSALQLAFELAALALMAVAGHELHRESMQQEMHSFGMLLCIAATLYGAAKGLQFLAGHAGPGLVWP